MRSWGLALVDAAHVVDMLTLDLTALTDVDLDWDLSWLPEVERGLEWIASHTDGYLPLAGGYPAIRTIFSAVDGSDAWPWTVVQLIDGERSAQVLGTADECVLELGNVGGFRMVRRVVGDEDHVLLPPACRYWIGAVPGAAIHTAAEATAIATEWLRRGVVAEGHRVVPAVVRNGRR